MSSASAQVIAGKASATVIEAQGSGVQIAATAVEDYSRRNPYMFDHVALTDGFEFTYERILTDSVIVVDQLGKQLDIVRSDSAAATDARSQNLIVVRTDTVSTADEFSRTATSSSLDTFSVVTSASYYLSDYAAEDFFGEDYVFSSSGTFT